MIYAADFETTTNPNDCRVWAWSIADIEEPEESIEFGNTIESFIERIKVTDNTYFFHNLKFDGGFIVDWLLRNGFKHRKLERREKLNMFEFTTLISEMGTWYTMKICFNPDKYGITHTVEIRDSLRIIPLPIEQMPKAFGLKEHKLELDYHEDRPIGHELTQHEKDYISGDVIILAKSLQYMIEHGQTKLTSASNALNDYRTRIGRKEFNKLFPELNKIVDKDCRLSYKGGWTYVNPKYKDQYIGEGLVLDVNSMYPWAMKYCLLPWGLPYYYTGKYEPIAAYPLYIQNLTCEFKLKPGKYPSIQIKGSFRYAENEYLVCSDGPTTLTLTSVDLALMFENYDVDVIEWIGGYMFRAKHGMFTEYIDYWYAVKDEANRIGNAGLKQIAKLMLNSLYGKFGSRQTGYSKIPYLDTEKDIVRYRAGPLEDRKGGYLPVATFITSYCRDKIIRAANACGDRFVYADTDSLHIKGTEFPKEIEVDNYKLGAFKIEEEFKRAKFIRQKTYFEVYETTDKDGNTIEKIDIKCAGMPRNMKDSITEENFRAGAVFDPAVDSTIAPKLIPKVVKGGVILRETAFQIKQ